MLAESVLLDIEFQFDTMQTLAEGKMEGSANIALSCDAQETTKAADNKTENQPITPFSPTQTRYNFYHGEASNSHVVLQQNENDIQHQVSQAKRCVHE